MLDAGSCVLRCTCDHTREATHTLRMQNAHRHSRVIPAHVESWPNTHCAWDCTQQHTWCTRNCRQVGLHASSCTGHMAVHTACTGIAPANTHTAQGVVDCPLTKAPQCQTCSSHQMLSLMLQDHTPVTSRDPQGGSARCCPRMPTLQPVLGHTPRSRGCSAPQDPNITSAGCSPSPSIPSWEWLHLTPSGEGRRGWGEGYQHLHCSPSTAAHSPGPLPPGAGPLCRGFGFQCSPPSCIPAFPGASHSQPGQSPPALIPPCGHLPTDKASLSALGSEGSCGTVGMGVKISPSSHCHCFYSSSPQVS